LALAAWGVRLADRVELSGLTVILGCGGAAVHLVGGAAAALALGFDPWIASAGGPWEAVSPGHVATHQFKFESREAGMTPGGCRRRRKRARCCVADGAAEIDFGERSLRMAALRAYAGGRIRWGCGANPQEDWSAQAAEWGAAVRCVRRSSLVVMDDQGDPVALELAYSELTRRPSKRWRSAIWRGTWVCLGGWNLGGRVGGDAGVIVPERVEADGAGG